MTTRFTYGDLAGPLLSLSRRWLWLLVLLITSILVFSGIGLRTPWPADEPRFAEVAREMVVSGQWLIPMRGGEYYPDKPPVFMWAIAFFYWLTGNLKLSFLLPNALCGLITVAAVFDLAGRLWNRRVAAVSVLLLLLAPQFVLQAKLAQIDAMVACWITLACYGLLRHFFTGPAWGYYFAAWGLMGLGIITKGVGFLPAFMMIPILWLHFRDPEIFTGRMRWRAAFGPVVMLLVAAAWVLPMMIYVDHLGTPEALAYRDNILFHQTAERYANSWGHIRPWYYFILAVIPVLWFPLPFLLLASLKTLREAWIRQPVVFVILVWVVLIIVFFSLSPGKRGVYLLPALPMMSVAIAAVIVDQKPARWLNALLVFVQASISASLIVLGTLVMTESPALESRLARISTQAAGLHEAGIFFMVMGGLWGAALLFMRNRPVLSRFAVTMAVSWVLVSTWGYHLLEPLRSTRNFLETVENRLPTGAELGLVRFKEQFILFSRLDVTHFGFHSTVSEQERNAWIWMNEGASRYVLASAQIEMQCFDLAAGVNLGVMHRRHWILLGPDQQSGYCEPPLERKRFFTPDPGRWLVQ